MSNSAFERLKYIELNNYLLDCPIDIEKGAILLDRERDRVLLQLKLVNISNHRISSIHILVYSFDNAKDTIPGIDPISYDYLDLKLDKGESTGEKNPVILNKSVRDVSVIINKVVFESGEIWRSEEKETYEKPEQESLKSIGTERLEYLHYVLNKNGIDSSNKEYFPMNHEDIWICSCGRPNYNSSNKCVRCHVEKEQIFDIININNLDASLRNHKLELKKQEEERKKIELKNYEEQQLKIEQETREKEKENLLISEKRKKLSKIIALGFIIVISLTLFMLTLKNYIVPSIKYNKAVQYFKEENYTTAISIFVDLDDYKDSKKYAEIIDSETKYVEANILLDNKKYSEAYSIFSNIKEYKNSAKLIEDLKVKIESEEIDKFYQEALQYIKINDYLNAISKLERIHPYKDSTELLPELKYLFLIGDVDFERYNLVDKYFNDIKGYKDINDQIQNVKYKYAIDLYKNKWFLEAKSLFNDIKNTYDINSYLESFYYKIEGVWDYQDNELISDSTFKLSEHGKLIETAFIEQVHEWDKAKENTYKINFNNVIVDVEILEVNDRSGGKLILDKESSGVINMKFVRK